MSWPTLAEYSIPTGWHGTAATIAAMQKLASEGKREYSLLLLAAKLARNVEGERNYRGWAEEILNYVRSTVKYVNDPRGVEMVSAPAWTIARGAGDCDDMALLVVTLAEILGMRAWYATVMASAARPNDYSHVYAVIAVPGAGRLGADATQMLAPLGWEPPFPAKLWPGSLEDM